MAGHDVARGRWTRSLAPGPGPLVRRSDRVQAASRLLLVLALLCAVPVAFAAGRSAARAAAELAVEQAALVRPAQAVLIETTTDVTLGNAGDQQWTAASWTGPGGSLHTGVVSAPVGSTAGQTVPIWIDADGALTPPPLAPGDVTDRGVVRGLLVLLGAAAAAALVHSAVCGVLERRRAGQWARDWAAVEPVWTARR